MSALVLPLWEALVMVPELVTEARVEPLGQAASQVRAVSVALDLEV